MIRTTASLAVLASVCYRTGREQGHRPVLRQAMDKVAFLPFGLPIAHFAPLKTWLDRRNKDKR